MKSFRNIILVVIPLLLLTFVSSASAGWSRSVGGVGYITEVNAVQVDSLGNTIVLGEFDGTVDFGSGPVVSAGGVDFYLASYAPVGSLNWVQTFGDVNGNGDVGDLAIDFEGNITICGSLRYNVDFGGGAVIGGSWAESDIFIAKFRSDGTHVWSYGFGTNEQERATSIGVDAAGNVYIAGTMWSSLDLGSGIFYGAGAIDNFVAKFDSLGTNIWGKALGGAMYQKEIDLALDSAGNLVLATYNSDSVDYGGGLLPNAGGYDIHLIKLDNSGTYIWAHSFGDASPQYVYDIEVDSVDNIIITGAIGGSTDFGGGVLISPGLSNPFIAKFDSSGTHIWSQLYGPGDGTSYAVALGPADEIHIAGVAMGVLDFGGGMLGVSGSQDVFLASFDAAGAPLFSQTYGDIENQSASALAVDPIGRVVISGFFTGGIDFGQGSITSQSATDGFVVLDPGLNPNPAFPILANPYFLSLGDYPNDQGKQVRISFVRMDLDRFGSPTPVMAYEIYRRIDDSPAANKMAGWDYVGQVSAYGDDVYNIIVPTLIDSTITSGMHWSTFMVRATTAVPVVYFDSAVDSVYSLDNLVPAAPLNVVLTNPGILSWQPVTDPDFNSYRIYGSANPTPDGSELQLATTSALSLDVQSLIYAYYFVSAVDHAGNESTRIVNVVDPFSGVPIRVASFSIEAYPNPFNPSTTIRFTVSRKGPARLEIFDLVGRRVRILHSGPLASGAHSFNWDGTDDRGEALPSGVYLAHVISGQKQASARMVLLK